MRIYFLYDRKLLAKLSKCAWNVISAYLKSTMPDDDAVIENMLSWYHSGFHVYIGDRIEPDDNLKVTRKTGPGNLARYIIRACFSQERMVYIPAKKSGTLGYPQP